MGLQQDHPSGAGFGKAAPVISCSSSPQAGRAVQFVQHRAALTLASSPRRHPGLTHAHPHHRCPLLLAHLRSLCCQKQRPRKMSVFTTESCLKPSSDLQTCYIQMTSDCQSRSSTQCTSLDLSHSFGDICAQPGRLGLTHTPVEKGNFPDLDLEQSVRGGSFSLLNPPENIHKQNRERDLEQKNLKA